MDTRLSELIRDQNLVTLDSNTTLDEALDTLASANVTGAPVLESGKAKGFVDVLDTVAFLVKTTTKPLTTRESESKHLNTDDSRMLRKRSKDFKIAHVSDLVDLSKRNPLVTIPQDSSVGDALNSFVKNRVHRVMVTDQQGSIKGIVTQTMLLRHLEGYLSQNDILKDARAIDLKITPVENMVLVGPKCLAIDAFMEMHINNVSAVAVIEGRKVLANLSASDLKSPYARDFSKMLQFVTDWLKEAHSTMNKSADYLVSCTQDTRVLDMIHRLNKERVHRIFVVEHVGDRLLGVSSLTDILAAISARIPRTVS